MLGLGRILISDLVVANLLMYSLPVMILLYLAASFFHTEGALDEIPYTYKILRYVNFEDVTNPAFLRFYFRGPPALRKF